MLVTRSNTRKLVGDAALVKSVRPRTIMSDLIYRLRPKDDLRAEFLVYALLSPGCRFQMEREARGSSGTMPKLAQRHIRGLITAFPPLHEQESVVTALDNSLAKSGEATERAESEIALLREYRTRLIADVVTGRVDVREAAASLADETDADERDIEEPDDTLDDAAESTDDDEAAE